MPFRFFSTRRQRHDPRLGATLPHFIALSLVLVLAFAGAASASQSPAHVYIALQAKQGGLSQNIRDIIDAAPDHYLAGAAGPDTAYTSNYIRVGVGTNPPGTESHDRTSGKLTCNLLRLAGTAQEKAYALGWLTHWETDNIIHALVNKYGGLYTEDEKRHKLLEMMECEHVFSKYVGPTVPDEYIPKAACTPRRFINSAYAATYTSGWNSSAYRESDVVNPKTGTVNHYPPSFIGALATGADNMETVCRSWVEMHNTGTYAGLWAWAENAIAVKGPPPTKEEYTKMMQPLKIDNVEVIPPGPDEPFGAYAHLKISYTVNDARLLAEFCREWNARKTEAINRIVARMNDWGANPNGFSLPANDLNLGYRDFDKDDRAMAWPGNPAIDEMLVFIEMKDPQGRPMELKMPSGGGRDWDAAGEWLPCDAVKQSWSQWFGAADDPAVRTKVWGGSAGTSSFKVPFEYTAMPRDITVTMKFADKKDKAPYGPESTWKGGVKPELSILFLMDCSGSMSGEKLSQARSAALAAVDKTNDGKTEWAVARFGGCRCSVVCRFTTSPAKVKEALNNLGANGDTPLTYSRNLALAYLVSKGSGKQGRMVILCDGEDNCKEHGSASADDAGETLRALLPPITIDATPKAGQKGGGQP